jgi:hypothetical protein
MQTFLPYPNFRESARVLDRQRLGKQRVESWQILTALSGAGKGWHNHPAVKMWRGHEYALTQYGIAVCDEWIARGYRDTCRQKIADMFFVLRPGDCGDPPWLGDPEFHGSHRANLLRKAPEWYSQFGWTEDPTTPYVWPV